jgi:hypothetical protein
MGRVDDSADALGLKIRCQAFNAAEPADALSDWRRRGIGGRARQRQNGLDPGLGSDPPGQRARFRRPAENEQTKAVQKAAP